MIYDLKARYGALFFLIKIRIALRYILSNNEAMLHV